MRAARKRRSLRRAAKMKSRSLAAPYLVWMALFTIVPLAIVAYFAFTDSQTGEFTMKNIANLGNYMPILIKSIWLALISSLICLVIGYPVAYYIAGCNETTQRFLYMLVMLPMCISFLLRTLAWVALTEDTGIINNIITALGMEPLPLIRNNGAVVLGMVYNYLPYMIMPLYTVIMKIDRHLIEAAEDLGSNAFSKFRRVILPLTRPGIISGITMVFVPSASTFLVSQYLGGTDDIMIGDIIDKIFWTDQNTGSAISLILMVFIFVFLILMNFFGDEEAIA